MVALTWLPQLLERIGQRYPKLGTELQVGVSVDLFRALGTAAERQSASWQPEAGSLPSFAPSARARIAVRLARTLGPRRVPCR